tara:strand:- start:8794 stop:9591 length:798 start_codon:yes stop_codon:yes gene_type:complete
MKIGIIGLGAIGNANFRGLQSVGHEVIAHDIKLGTHIKVIEETCLTFVCVPTPSLITGECDTTIVENVLAELSEIEYAGAVCIRSTVLPGFTAKMAQKFKNLQIAFVPEFLRERCALEDFIENHNLLAIGTLEEKVFELVRDTHAQLPKNVVKMTPTEAELLKYYNNSFAALRIIFANFFFELCERLEANYPTVKNSYLLTGKAKDLYLDVNEDLRGYAGVCLPKDVKAIAMFAKEIGVDMDLMKAVDSDNQGLKHTVFEGMRHS